MKRIYGESGQYSIAEENELFGIVDNSGHLLLPLEYDRITVAYGIKDGFGFILCKNGKFGYVEFPYSRSYRPSTRFAGYRYVPSTDHWAPIHSCTCQNSYRILPLPSQGAANSWFSVDFSCFFYLLKIERKYRYYI